MEKMHRGTKPKPTRLKLLTGNPGRRALNEREPQPPLPPSLPDPPTHLSRDARKEWRRAGEILLGSRVLTRADLSALALYATFYGRWVQAERDIKRRGIMVPASPRSKIKVQNPMLAVANKCAQQISQLQGEFGLTPSSRTRIIAAEPADSYVETAKAERFLGPRPIRPAPR